MCKKKTNHARRPKHKTRHDYLASELNSRITVSATVTRTGVAYENNCRLRTLLLHDVNMTSPHSKPLGDHIWIKLSPYATAVPRRGDRVEFSAYVREYTKKYEGRDKTASDDIGLFDIENLTVVGSWND